MSHKRWACFLLLLLPVSLLAADGRRPAIVVLDEPAVVEQMAAGQPDRPHRLRSRLLSDEGATLGNALRTRKLKTLQRIRGTGAEVTGQTETVLNAVMVQATPDELRAIGALSGVVSAQFAREYELLLDAAVPLIRVNQAWQLPAINGVENAGRGVKIGIIDSGIDNTHPMFQDSSLTPPAGYPKGDTAYTTNKIIVARNELDSCSTTTPTDCDPRDNRGHGTFVAAIAAGGSADSPSPAARVSGIAPKAFIGNYRVFGTAGNSKDTLVIKAIDDAVADGMDIVNLSLGSSNPLLPLQDSSYTAIENARKAGVLVVSAAGNSGPGSKTVSSPCTLPQVVCVGSVTNAHRFYATVQVLSEAGVPASLSKLIALPGSVPSVSTQSPPLEIVDVSALDPSGLACPVSSTNPSGVNFAAGSLTGKIALIKRGICFFRDKLQNATTAGAAGAIIYNNLQGAGPLNMDTAGSTIPSMSIGTDDGAALKSFLAQQRATAVFDPALVGWPSTADLVVNDSSRGPGPDLAIKPDIVAPGDVILSATENVNPSGDMYNANRFTSQSGTSFASPMVVGAAALLKQAHPAYTPEQLKSLLVNTAFTLTASTQDGALPAAVNSGAGRLDALAALRSTLAANPVSISIGQQASFVASARQPVTISNLGTAADSLSLTLVVSHTDPKVSLTLSTASLSLGAGESGGVELVMSASAAPESSSEGVIEVRSQTTGRTIRIPYWVSASTPVVSTGGVVNAANYTAANGVAPGTIVSVFGTSLASLPSTLASALPLPTILGGSELLLGSTRVPLFFSSSRQINGMIPFNTSAGAANAQIKVDGASFSFSLPITDFSPGLFSLDMSGKGSGAIVHSTGGIVTSANPASGGETVLIYGTGLGAVTNPPSGGNGAPLDSLVFTVTQPVVTIGGVKADVKFSGLAPGFAGLYQLNVVVPAGVPAGDQPVVLTIGANNATSNTVTIAIK